MNVKPFALAGIGGSLAVAGAASAAFTGLSLEAFVGDGWNDNGYGATGLTTWRLYANFDGAGPDDGVISVFGIGGVPLSVSSPTGLFHNDPLGGLTAPLDLRPAGLWGNQWDTYVTINQFDTNAGDATTTSPGFDTATNNLGSDWVTENGGWFVTPDDEQSKAVDGRVGLAQFSVAGLGPGDSPSGVVNLLLRDGNQPEQIVFPATPAPGALALLGLAGLAGSRRRRR